jgi:hypothetical protein
VVAGVGELVRGDLQHGHVLQDHLVEKSPRERAA